VIEYFEEALINADASFSIVSKIITPELSKLKTADEVKEQISSKIISILKPKERSLKIEQSNTPFVIFIAGVNGSGKTTTIGKLANKFALEGKKVLVGACDTFRVAATEQLEAWVKQAGISIEKRLKEREDPSAVCYRSVKRAVEEKFDVLIIDTSGRLHSNKALMDELSKMQFVIRKINLEKPDISLLVIDGSAGQNAISQGREFAKFIKLDGLCITKLDSSSKGGAVLSIANELDLGIYFVGVGEDLNDLSPFHAEEFVKNIFEN
jgi:fused signal recognition particle receptor